VNTPVLNHSQTSRLVLDLPALEGWKTELTYGDWLNRPAEMVYPYTDGHPSK